MIVFILKNELSLPIAVVNKIIAIFANEVTLNLYTMPKNYVNPLGDMLIKYFRAHNKMSPTLVKQLCDHDYTKANFNVNFPLLVAASMCPNYLDHPRYYQEIFTINGVEYRLCNHLFHKDGELQMAQKWIAKHP